MASDNKDVQVHLTNARRDDQRQVMEQIQKDGVCPFCPDHFLKYHSKPIIREGKHWIATHNAWPYPNTAHHLLFVTKRHVTSISGLTPEMSAELVALSQWALDEFDIIGGTLLMRFGDPTKNGSSVTHLHAQLVVGDPEKEGYSPVLTRIG